MLFRSAISMASIKQLPMKGKRHPNGYVEHHGKPGQLGRSSYQRYRGLPHYRHEFGHFEGDTVQGKAHRGAVMTLVERQCIAMIVLSIHHKTDDAVNCQLDQWLAKLPRHFVKSMAQMNLCRGFRAIYLLIRSMHLPLKVT